MTARTNLASVFVPTIAAHRTRHLFEIARGAERPLLVVGERGSGKTAVVENCLRSLPVSSRDDMTKILSFSAYTLPVVFQESIEAELVGRGGRHVGPRHGKSLVVFIDDVSMPAKD
eukprot:6188755-Prorocentrum_lima.AAC.1